MVPIVIKTSQKAIDTFRRAESQFQPVITALQLTCFLQIVICMHMPGQSLFQSMTMHIGINLAQW